MRPLLIARVLFAPCLLAFAFALTLAPRSARAEVVSLEQLTRVAVQNRPALAATAAQTRAARAEVARAKSGYYPRLSLEAGSSLAPGRRLFPLNPGSDVLVQGSQSGLTDDSSWTPSVRTDVDLELRGSLYDFGRTRAAEAAGRAVHASAQAAEEATRAAIVLAVRAAYLNWLGQHALLAIAERAAVEAESRTARVQALIAEGARPPAELSVARADEMLGKLELERTRGQTRIARLELAQTVGSPLADNAEPDASLLDNGAAGAAGAPAPADAALRVLALRQRAAVADARRLEHADAPLLAGAVSAGVRTQFGIDQEPGAFPAYAVGINFSMPLLDGGESASAAAAARARAEALSAELEDERLRHDDARARAQLDHDNAEAQLQTAATLLEVATQRVSEAEQAFELGAGGLEPLAAARALLRKAQAELVYAKLARAEAALRLSAR